MKRAILIGALAMACGGEPFEVAPSTPAEAGSDSGVSGSGGSESLGGSGGSGEPGGSGGADVISGGSGGDDGVGGDAPLAGMGGEPGIPNGSLCDDTHPCGAMSLCADNVCIPKSEVGGVCRSNSDCLSDNCREGECEEPREDYTGPPWIECKDGQMVARGFYGYFDEVSFTFDAQSRGSEWELFPVTPLVNGETTPAGSDVENASLDATTMRAYLDITIISEGKRLLLQPSDIITTTIFWQPTESGSGGLPQADVSSCGATLGDGSPVNWN